MHVVAFDGKALKGSFDNFNAIYGAQKRAERDGFDNSGAMLDNGRNQGAGSPIRPAATCLTFTRPGELRLAPWKEFDLDAGVWTIPAHRMKMRRPHRVPLAPQTVATLEDLRTLTGQFELLFPGVRSPSERRPLRFSTNVASGMPTPSKRSSPMSRPTRCERLTPALDIGQSASR